MSFKTNFKWEYIILTEHLNSAVTMIHNIQQTFAIKTQSLRLIKLTVSTTTRAKFWQVVSL